MPFDFTEFARSIYQECPSAHPTPYLLPALYGGEPSVMYEAIFVLNDPLVSFIEERWEPCASVESAIQVHRSIFLAWAAKPYPAILFGAFHITAADFFKRFYVTDVWKDSAFKTRRKESEYRNYWRSKLAVELTNVSARCVITVGGAAQKEVGQLSRSGLIRLRNRPEHVSHPSTQQRGITQKGYGEEVSKLIHRIELTT